VRELTDREMIDQLSERLEQSDSGFTAWEMDFVEDMRWRVVAGGRGLTGNQHDKLEEIFTEKAG